MRRLQQAYDLSVQWLAFPLHPETPPEGMTLEQLFAGRGLDIPAMLARLQAVAREEDLPFGPRSMTFNSRRAQELGKWAEEQGQAEAFHAAAFAAYFAHGRNLYDLAVLREIAQTSGLDPDRAEAVVSQGLYAEAVDRDWRESRAMGVSAVPTFMAGGRGLVGAQPYAELERLVGMAGAAPRRT